LRILYISDVVYPWNKGGSEYRIYRLSGALSRRGHEVSIVCGKWWAGQSKVGNIHGLSILRRLYTPGRSGVSAASFTLSLLRALPGLDRYDIVELNMSPMLHFSILDLLKHTRVGRSAAVVGAMHEVWQEHWFRYVGPLYGSAGYLLEHHAAMKLDRIVTISEFNVRRLARWNVPASRVSVVRPGVDWDEVRRAPASGQESDLIFVGRLVESKRPDVFVETVRMLKEKGFRDVKAVVVGGGPMLGRLISMARALRVEENITFTGFVSRDVLLSHLKSSRVFLQPTPPEGGWSISFLEANAAGLPVVSSSRSTIGTSSEIIREGENGFVAREPSALQFADLVGLLLQDRGLARSVSERAIEFAKAYDWNEIANQVQSLYTNLISGRANVN
jgi:glycosyltransferase involved in cell wall biosynthesis